ncbi:MAG: hypothetical protein IJV91_00525 [Kiritimatiellae bacterium]|nr:hypothetical protein [Kiritimatiellia bacterium]
MNVTRKDFLSLAASAAAMPVRASSPAPLPEIKAMLMHWGLNQWGEYVPGGLDTIGGAKNVYKTKVLFDEAVWNRFVDAMVAAGMNMVVVDLGEFPVYPSHPELALPGSRSPEWILSEVRRLKKLGLELIPKLNFSATHDAWLQEYSHMLTTSKYRQVCSDIIRDTSEMFDHPRFLHIGYDEEGFELQKGFKCVRCDEVWWSDFLYIVNAVESCGMRTWMWSDYGWRHEDFADKCPKQVLQSNWYYDEQLAGFDMASMAPSHKLARVILNLYKKLDKAGFDQVPCGSNWKSKKYRDSGRPVNDSIVDLVKYGRKFISREHLKGFMMGSWSGCTQEGEQHNMEAISLMQKAVGFVNKGGSSTA